MRLSDLKLKFALNVVNDPPSPQEQLKFKSQDVVSKFKIGGNTYLRISPFPNVTFENIKTTKNSAWDPGNSISMTKSYLLIFIRKLKVFIQNFQIQNLYVYSSNHLVLNKELSSHLNILFPVGNKAIRVEYTVVTDNDNKEIEYEGALIKINNDLNFVLLTYDELFVLYDTLEKLDFESLSLQLINTAVSYNGMQTKEIHHYEQSHEEPQMQLQRGLNMKVNSQVMPKL